MIEAYAITDATPGIEPPLRSVRCASLNVICGPANDGPVDAEALWRHEGVVESLMEECDLLPFRYGTRFAGEEELTDVIAGRAAALTAALDRVRGAVELSVRVRSAVAEGSARLATATDDKLRPLARDSRRRTPGSASEVLRAAYLVDRDAVGSFTASVATLDAAHPGLDLLCTGPWPPYSFAER